MAVEFLNIDLEIRSHTGIDAIVEEFRNYGEEPLFYGRIQDEFLGTFEVSGGVCMDSVENIFIKFKEVLKEFGPAAKLEWENASSRVFDIGFRSLDNSVRKTYPISSDIINFVSQVSAGIALTHYPHQG